MDPLEHALQRAHSVSADVVIDIFLQSSAIDHWTLGLAQRQQRSAVQTTDDAVQPTFPLL
jgi:hypothetical protein